MGYDTPIYQPAVTLPEVYTLVSGNSLISALVLRNTSAAAVVATVKDGNGKVLAAQSIDPLTTFWADWANRSNGRGFYFDGACRLYMSTANVVDCWVMPFKTSGPLRIFNTPVINQAVTLPATAQRITLVDTLLAALAFHNNDVGTVNVTVKDGAGKIIESLPVGAGITTWLDLASITQGDGMYFAGGVSVVADVAGMVDCWPAGLTA